MSQPSTSQVSIRGRLEPRSPRELLIDGHHCFISGIGLASLCFCTLKHHVQYWRQPDVPGHPQHTWKRAPKMRGVLWGSSRKQLYLAWGENNAGGVKVASKILLGGPWKRERVCSLTPGDWRGLGVSVVMRQMLIRKDFHVNGAAYQ